MINQIYEEVYGINLGLENFDIRAENTGNVNGLIYFNNKWGAWDQWSDPTIMEIIKKNIFS